MNDRLRRLFVTVAALHLVEDPAHSWVARQP